MKQVQVHAAPVGNEEEEESQRLVEAIGRGDMESAMELLLLSSSSSSDDDDVVENPFRSCFVDVNCSCPVLYRGKKAEVVLKEEAAGEVRIDYEEAFMSDLSPLFLASHHGLLPLIRKLLSMGADVNQKLFRGYATTAAVREGRRDVLEILMKAGANQLACEEALLEASCHGKAELVELLMQSDFVRPNVAVRALVLACSRGFVDVVDALVKCGVDANATDRALLRSLKPSLHTNLYCTPLVAAIVGRQAAVVRQLLEAGVRKDTMVSLGAWSWDTANGEEFRVGAGLAEPYNMAWCAVEYFESTGTILRMFLDHHSPNTLHYGRSLLHHAILCSNRRAVETLLASGADCELPITTTKKYEFRPVHMASRLGQHDILQSLCDKGCDPDSRTDSGDTALMLCARYRRKDCIRVLVAAGADLGLVNNDGASAESVAAASKWRTGFRRTVLDAIRSGATPATSNNASLMMFAASCGDVGALEVLLMQQPGGVDINKQDENGFSPVMVAAREGHVDSFRLLVFGGANVSLANKSGETAVALCQLSENSELLEQVMLECTLEKGDVVGGFCALHCAARRGDLLCVHLLTNRGYDVNVANEDGYTPLMLAAREGHGKVCRLLIACGAKCDVESDRGGETALSLARKNCMAEAEGVILDELARIMVFGGGRVKKHTKRGKGSPHGKVLAMVGVSGVLRWGKSKRRNVVCKEAEVGGSFAFRKNRRRKGDSLEPGLFRVVTTNAKEFHFVCEGGDDAAELWVRGIINATNAAASAKRDRS